TKILYCIYNVEQNNHTFTSGHWSFIHYAQTRLCSSTAVSSAQRRMTVHQLRDELSKGPRFPDFIQEVSPPKPSPARNGELQDDTSYLTDMNTGHSRKVYFETYGCQMNVNDTDIAMSILQSNGYQRTKNLNQADVVLLVTCSIREKAEQTIWNRLQQLKAMKKKRLKSHVPLKIGILGNKLIQIPQSF
uniref:MTTase N-terminal domain-containing protein n=1 Tax=Periophthalmus magnuspinnatus TaxID=409849 RepID=A0A3B3ZTG3_9GOBI